MDATNVQPGTPPGYCGAIADELRRIADALAAVEHLELPEPRYVHLHIQPGGTTDDEVIAAVNALGQAVVGKAGAPDKMSGGSYHYAAENDERAVYFRVYREISLSRARSMDPNYQPDERDVELEQLRAEVAKLRGDETGLNYGRGDEGLSVQPAAGRVEPQYAGVLKVADGHIVHSCCGKVDDAAHENYCANWTPGAPARLVPLLSVPMRDEQPRQSR